MGPRRWLALTAITAALLAGCGSSRPTPPSDVQAVSAVIKNYLSALAAGNGPAACRLMTKAYQGKIVSGPASRCAPALSTLAYQLTPAQMGKLDDAKIAVAKVKGDRASVRVKGQKGSARLTKVGKRWLISGGTAG